LHNHLNRQLGKHIHVSYEHHRDTFELFRAGGKIKPVCILHIVPENTHLQSPSMVISDQLL
jgi:hypothetical protein